MANKYLYKALALALTASTVGNVFQGIKNKGLESKLDNQTAAVRQTYSKPNYLESNATLEAFYKTLEQSRGYKVVPERAKDFEKFFESISEEAKKELINYQRNASIIENSLTYEDQKVLDLADEKATAEDYKTFFWINQRKLTYADKMTIALKHSDDALKHAAFDNINFFSP